MVVPERRCRQVGLRIAFGYGAWVEEVLAQSIRPGRYWCRFEIQMKTTRISYNNGMAYQFNGASYQPVFVNGVTRYMTVPPNSQACRDDDVEKVSVKV